MPLPDDDFEECLARARYARARAEEAKTQEDRQGWIRIAEEWQDLANFRRAGQRPQK